MRLKLSHFKHRYLPFSRIHKPFNASSSFLDMYPHYKPAVADPMCAYSSLFFRMHLFALYCSLLISWLDLTAAQEWYKWALPGTEHFYNQQLDINELAALQNSITPFKHFKFAIAATPSPTISHRCHMLHHQAIHHHLLTNTLSFHSPGEAPCPDLPSDLKVKVPGKSSGDDGITFEEDVENIFDTGESFHLIDATDWERGLFCGVRLSQYYCK